MEIKEMQMSDIEKRSAEIEELLKSEDADIDSLTKEVEEMEARKERTSKRRIDEQIERFEEWKLRICQCRTLKQDHLKLKN